MNASLEEIDRQHDEAMQAKPKVVAKLPNGGTYTVYSPGSAPGCANAIASNAGMHSHTGPRKQR